MEKKSDKKKLIHIVGILLGIIIVAFMIKKLIENWQELKVYLIECQIALFVISILLYALAFLLIGWNWAYVAHYMDKTLSVTEYLNLHMSSVLAKYIPGGIWNIVGKAYLCTQKGVEKSATTASIILEYVFQIISSGLFFLFLLPLLLKEVFTPWMAALLVAAIIIACLLLPWGAKLGIKILGKVFKEDMSAVSVKTSYIYQMLLQYVFVWLFTGIGLVVMSYSFLRVSMLQGVSLILAYPVSWVTGFLSPSPNGMGVREGMLQILLSACYQSGPLLLIVLTTRIWTMLGEIVAVGGFRICYKVSKKRRNI